ncbi:MAG TPA: ATP-binding protein [Streptomyces sp.]|nr:ATP-binding protein [Streptomyces sp.]
MRTCRETVRTSARALGRDSELTDLAVLLTSESVSNAINACAGSGCPHPISLHGEWGLPGGGRRGMLSGSFRIHVRDGAPGVPVVRKPAPTDVHGRGMHLIASLPPVGASALTVRGLASPSGSSSATPDGCGASRPYGAARLSSARLQELRAAAGVLHCLGLRIEINAAEPAPPPRWGRTGGIVRRVRLGGVPPPQSEPGALEGVFMQVDADMYATPDVIARPSGLGSPDRPLVHPQAVDIKTPS